MTAFRLERVSKSFGSKRVLQALDLEVPEGQFIAVVGKSGCGKSTLLRLLAGLERPDAGRIRVASPGPGQTGTRIMFQEPRLLPWARVEDNVAIGLTGTGQEGTAARLATQVMLEEVGLDDRGGDWPAVLSGGQKSRVALARALVGRPQVLALDEPLGALDALTRIEMQRLLERIWQRQGFTALLVTHDVAEAVLLADRVVVLEEGRSALDVEITLPRPRRHGSPEVAQLESAILERLLGAEAA